MDISLKQRLAGAGVLVALAVILLPALLDGAGEEAKRDLDIRIPPPPSMGNQLVIPEPAPLRVEEPSQLMVESSGRSEEPISESRSSALSLPKPAPVPAERPRQVPKSEPKAADPASDLQSWVVQVASFSQRQGAEAKRDELSQFAQYHAFVESGFANGRKVYRVRIGPMHSRERADELNRLLKQKKGISGMVLRNP